MIVSDSLKKRRSWNQTLYERTLNNSILKVLHNFISKNTNTIDVGGNTGYQTKYHSNYNTVYTYEPVPGLFEILKNNLKDLQNVNFINKAVGQKNGEIKLYVDMNRMSMTSQMPLVDNTQEIVVPCVSLDEENYDNVGFIKVDVEGYELDVLKGCVNLIEKFTPTFMIEIYEPWCKKTGIESGEYFKFLIERNYRAYYYDNIKSTLVSLKDTNSGIDAVKNKHHLHDGDFLFTHDRRIQSWPFS